MKEFKIKLSADIGDLTNQFKAGSKELRKFAEGVSQAENKMEALSQTSEYLAQMDAQLAKLAKKYPNVFNQIFGTVDADIKKALAPIMQAPDLLSKSLSKIGGQLEGVLSGKIESEDIKISQLGREVKAITKALGAEVDLKFLDGSSKEETKAKKLINILAQLEKQYTSLGKITSDKYINEPKNKKKDNKPKESKPKEAVPQIPDINTSKVADELKEENNKIKTQIDQLEVQKNRYKEIIAALEGEEIKLKTKKSTDVQQLQELVAQFDEATTAVKKFETAKMTSGDEYKKALGEQYRLAALVKNTMDEVADNGSNKGSLYVAKQVENGTYSRAEDVLDSLKTSTAQEIKSVFTDILSSMENIASAPVESVSGKVENIGDSAKVAKTEVDALADSLKNALLTASQLQVDAGKGNVPAKETMNLVGANGIISSVQGTDYQVETQALIGQMLANLKENIIMSLHNHPDGMDAFTPSDIESFTKLYYGQGTKLNGIIADSLVKTIDFTGISQEVAIKISEAYSKNISDLASKSAGMFSFDQGNLVISDKIKALSQTKPNQYKQYMDIITSALDAALNDAFIQNGVESSLKGFTLEQMPELSSYIRTLQSSTEAALTPAEKLVNLFNAITPGSASNIGDFSEILEQFKSGAIDASKALDMMLEKQRALTQVENKVDVSAIEAETNAIAQKITSYEELCQVVERYNALILKSHTEGQKLTQNEEAELSAINDRFAATKGVNEDPDKFVDYAINMSRISGLLGEFDTNKLAQYLGVEIPQSTQQAQQAMEQAVQAFTSFQTLTSDIQSSWMTGTMNSEAIGKYTTQIDMAKTQLQEFANQGLITAEQMEQVNSMYEESLKQINLSREANDAEMMALKARPEKEGEPSGSYDSGFDDGYNQGQARAAEEIDELQKTVTSLQEELANAQQTSVTGIDSSTENTMYETLKGKITEVITEINAKTEAFKTEGSTVDSVVAQEIAALDKLLAKVNEIKGAVDAKTGAFKEESNAVSDSAEQAAKIKEKEATKKKKGDTFTSDRDKLSKNFNSYFNSLNLDFVSEDAINKLAEMESRLKSITNSNDLDKWKQDWAELTKSISQAAKEEENVALSKQKQKLNGIKNSLNKSFKATGIDLSSATGEQKELAESVVDLTAKLETYAKQRKQLSAEEISDLQKEANEIKQKADAYTEAARAAEEASKVYGDKEVEKAENKKIQISGIAKSDEFAGSTEVITALDNLNLAYDNLLAKQKEFQGINPTQEQKEEFANLINQYNQAYEALNKLIISSRKLDKQAIWSQPFNGSIDLKSSLMEAINASVEGRVKFGEFNEQLKQLNYSVSDGNGSWTHFTAQVDSTGTKIVGLKSKLKQTDGLFKSLFTGSLDKFKQALTRFTGFDMFYRAIGQIKQGVQYVKEIDSALTELKKVTDETDETYARFLQTASQTSAKIGSTVSDFTNATADFARLGYSIDEAAQLAEAVSIYKNVGDGIETVSQASESIISTMKAFGIEAENAISIVDKFNEVGNNFAISSTGIGEALQRSASALAAAGNSLDESIALVTAANSVVQNPEIVGTALKTMSMRLRNTKVELSEMGEDADGAANSVSELQDKLLALTHGKVDIMKSATEYKNTTEVILGMADAWKEMTDAERAAALQLMGGQRQGNILASIIENADTLRDVLETTLNAEGSAFQENEKYLDSIQGKIDQFNNALQTMWMNGISSDFVKTIVSLGTELIKIVNTLGLIPSILATIAAIGLFKGTAPMLKNVVAALGLLISESIKTGKSMRTLAEETEIFGNIANISFEKVKKGLQSIGVFIKANPYVAVIAAIIAVGTIAVSIYNGLKQAELEAAESAQQSAQALQEKNSSLDSYKKKIESLRKSLDEGNLSEEEAYNVRKELMSIQDELIAKFGNEVKGINLVTGAIDKQIAALDALKIANANAWLNENSKGTGLFGMGDSAVDQAIAAVEEKKDRTTSLSGVFLDLEDKLNTDSYLKFISSFEKEISKLTNGTGVLNKTNAGQILSITFNDATKVQVEEYYDQISNWLREYAKNNGIDLGSLIGNIQSGKETILGDDWKTQKANYEAYLENTAVSVYTDAYGKILDARDKFKEEYAKGNNEEAKNARAELEAAINEAVTQAGEGTSQAKWFEGLDDSLASIFSDMDFSDAWDNVGSGLKASIEQNLKDINLDSDIDILNLGNFIDENGKLIDGVEGFTQKQADAYNVLVEKAREYGMTIDELIAKLVQLNVIQGDSFAGPATFDITNYTESIEAINKNISTYQEALDKLDSGSFTLEDFVELIKFDPKMAKGVDLTSKSFKGLTKNLKKAIKAAPDDLIETLEDLKDTLTTQEEIDEVDALIDALEDLGAQDFTSLIDQLYTLSDAVAAMNASEVKLKDAMDLNPDRWYDIASDAMSKIQGYIESNQTSFNSPLWDISRTLFGKDVVNKVLRESKGNAEVARDGLEAIYQNYRRWIAESDDFESQFNASQRFMQDIEQKIASNSELQKWMQDNNAIWANGKFRLDNSLWEEFADKINVPFETFTGLMIRAGQYFPIIFEDLQDLGTAIDNIIEEGKTDPTELLSGLEQIEDAVDLLLDKNGQDGLDWGNLLGENNLDALTAALQEKLGNLFSEEEIRAFATRIQELFNAIEVPEVLATSSINELDQKILSATITKSQAGEMFVDQKAFEKTAKNLDSVKNSAEGADKAIEGMLSGLEAAGAVMVNKTKSDPLGLDSFAGKAELLGEYLSTLGIQIETLTDESGTKTIRINTDDLIAKLVEANLTATQIKTTLDGLDSQEGIDLTVKAEDLSTEDIDAKIEALETDTVDIIVNADIDAASEAIQRLKMQIEELRTFAAENPISIKADTGEISSGNLVKPADSGLMSKFSSHDSSNINPSITSEDVNAQIASLELNPVKLNTTLDTTGIKNKITEFEASIDSRIDLQSLLHMGNIKEKVKQYGQDNPLELEADLKLDNITSRIKALESTPFTLTPDIKLDQDKMLSFEVNSEEVNAKIATIQEAIQSVQGKDVNINVNTNAFSVIPAVIAMLNSIPRVIQVTIVISVVGGFGGLGGFGGFGGFGGVSMIANGTAHAQGTAHVSGNWGLPHAEKKALVGELGQETVVDPSTGHYYTVGDTGAEFVSLPKGAIVFNHKQTEELFKHGYVTGRGKAIADGTAHATGTALASGSYGGRFKNYSKKHASGKYKNQGGEDTFEETIDWFEYLLEEINEQLDLMNAKLENAVGISSKNSLIGQMLTVNRDQISTLTEGVKMYTDYAAALLKDVPEKYREMVQNGAVDITDFVGQANEKTVDAIKKYREWAAKIEETKQKIEEVTKTISDLRVQALEMIGTEYKNEIGLIATVNDRINDTIDLLEEQGERVSANYYTEMIANAEKQLKKLQEQRAAMQAEFDDAVNSGDVKKYSEDWYDMLNSIYDVDSAIIECTQNIEEFDNAILELHWENFEKIIDALDSISDEAEQVRSVIKDSEIADELGNWTKLGITALGMASQEMEKARYRADLYGEQIKELDKQFAAGKYSQDEYRERLKELKDSQWDSIEAYESAKDTIIALNRTRIDAVKNGIQKEIDAYEELINKRKEDLDAQKDQHDWENTLKERTDVIDKIQRQINAMSGDNSAAAIAQRKKLEEELINAKEELNNTYYDRDIEQQQKALDDSLEAYRKDKENSMEELDKYLKEEDKVIKDAYALILANTENVAAGLQEISKKYNISISENVTAPWESGMTVLGTYETELDYATSSYVDMLERVRKELIDIQVQADKTAASLIKGIKNDVNNTQNNTFKTQSTAKKSTSVVPSLTNGAIVTVKKSATNFARDGGNGTKMQSWVPGSSFTVYQTAGDQVLLGIPGKGYTGWVRKQDLVGYAKGTTGVKNNQLAWIDENGLEELVIHANGNGKLAFLSKGTSVVPSDISENLMKLGSLDPTEMLKRNTPSIGAPHMIENNMQLNLEFGSLVHVDNATSDSIPELKEMVHNEFDIMMKKLNSGIKMYAR